MPSPEYPANSDELPWWLTEWLPAVPHGRALDLGAGDGRLAAWLAGAGFEVEAVERDPRQLLALRARAARPRLRAIEADVRAYPLAPGHYDLILAASIFHFLRPGPFARLAANVQTALRPAGVLMAEVFTADDPGCKARQAESADHRSAHTFQHPSEGWIHYFLPGELRAAFPDLDVLHYEESRRLDPSRPAGYYSAATLVAQAPAVG